MAQRPSELNLVLVRGDSFPIRINVTNNNAPLDISGSSFIMSANSCREPTDTSQQIFSINGVLVADVQGAVDFTPSSDQTDVTPGTYYYDIQETRTNNYVRTIVLGELEILQDITKG